MLLWINNPKTGVSVREKPKARCKSSVDQFFENKFDIDVLIVVYLKTCHVGV